MWFLYERLWITRGCYATMYLAALQAVFDQLGSFGCWVQAILRCRADLCDFSAGFTELSKPQ